MLKEIIEQYTPKKPPPFLPKVREQFNPSFVKALMNQADDEGLVNEANSMIVEKIQQNEDYNEKQLDDTWAGGIMAGYDTGVAHGMTPGYNKGLVDGLVAGWRDAETFKKPHRVYDLTRPSIQPIAEGKSAALMGTTIPDTIENRLWRATTDHMSKKGPNYPLNNYMKVADDPFVYHPEHNRLGLNLAKFAEQNAEVEGKEAKITGNGQTTFKTIKKNKADVIGDALGKTAEIPKLDPAKIPPRPGRKVKEPPQVIPQETPVKKQKAPKPPRTPYRTPAKEKKTNKKLGKLGIDTQADTPAKIPKRKGEIPDLGFVQLKIDDEANEFLQEFVGQK